MEAIVGLVELLPETLLMSHDVLVWATPHLLLTSLPLHYALQGLCLLQNILQLITRISP